MIKKEFFKSSLIYTFSSTLSTAASFLLLPFYTNTHLLEISDFGALSLYIGFSILVQLIASFCSELYVGTLYHELKHDPYELRASIASLNGYLVCIGLLIIGVAALGASFFIHHFVENSNPAAVRYIMMSALTGIFNAHFKFYNSLLAHLERPWQYFWSNILNFVTTVVFSLLILNWYPLTLEGPLWGRLLSCLCIYLLSMYEITHTYGIAFHRRFIMPLINFSLPLLLAAIFQWILGFSDRYIIKPLLFNKEVAVFDLAARCTFLVSFVLDGLMWAMSSKIYSLLREDGEKYAGQINKYYSGFNLVMLVIIPLNIFLLPIVLPFFIGDEKYIVSFYYFGIICSGLLTRSIQNLFIFPVYFFRKTKLFIPINGIPALLQIVLGYFMVKHFKLYGAAYTLNIVRIVQLIVFFYCCRHLAIGRINKPKLIVLPLVALIISSVPEVFIHQYGLQMHLVHLAELIIIFTMTYGVYRHEIWDLMRWTIKAIQPDKNRSA